ncbi:NosD domain-containing protein [Archaeoglobus sp.]
MVENGYAEIWDFTNNEFNPYAWKLYEPIGTNITKKVVNLDTGEEFTSIQAAIDDPDTKDGHIIVVYPGDYEENVIVNKSVTITSYAGNPLDTRIIALNKSLPTVTVLADNVKISGFKIEGSYYLYDYAVKVFGDDCKIIDNEISNHHGDIGIYNSTGSLVSKNKFSTIRVENSSNLNISSNTINVYDETGILCLDTFNISITKNTISGTEGTGVSLYRTNYSLIANNQVKLVS